MFSFLNRVYPNFRKIANAVVPNPNRPNAIKPIGNKFNNMPKAIGANGKYTLNDLGLQNTIGVKQNNNNNNNLNDARQKYQMQADAINKGQVELPNYVNVGDTSKMSPRMQQFLVQQQKRIAMDRLNKATYQNELKNIKPDNNNLWRNPDGSYSYNSPITGKEHKITKEDAKALNWDADQVAKIRNTLPVKREDPGVAVFNNPAYDAYINNQQQQINVASTPNSQVKQQPIVNNTTTQTVNQPVVDRYQDSPKYDPNNPAYHWQGNLGYKNSDLNKLQNYSGTENYYRYPLNDRFTNKQLEQQKQINEQYKANLKSTLQKNISKLDALINSPITTQQQKRLLQQKKQQIIRRTQKRLEENKNRDDFNLVKSLPNIWISSFLPF